MCVYIVLLSLLPIQALALEPDKERIDHINMLIDDQASTLNEPAFMSNGRLYFPVRNIVEALGGMIQWNNEDQQISITTTSGDKLLFTVGLSEIIFNDHKYVMDVPSFIYEDKVYLPLRHTAEFMHTDVEWDDTTHTASLTRTSLYLIEEGDTLASISTKLNITESLLLERNSNSDLNPGHILKVLIPTIMEHKVITPAAAPAVISAPAVKVESVNLEKNPDYMLLARIIQVEAGYESYESQKAVGSVIMNRVNDDRFPDSIKGVIYQKGQFPPAHNGLLDKSKPNKSSLLAAEEVWNGEINVVGALFFYNPKVTTGSSWSKRTLVKEIGNHRYVK